MTGSDDRSRNLPPPPAATPTDRWALDRGAIVPARQVPSALTAPTPPARRGRRTVLIAVLGALVVLAAAGGAAAYLFLRGTTADLLERIPADADAVAVVSLDPSASQKLNIARIADEFHGIGGGDDGVGGRLERWGDEVLDGTGLGSDDVTSWLGVELAVATDVVDGTPHTAVIADVADRDGAERMLAKLGVPGAAWDGVEWTERDHLGVTLSIPSRREGEVPAYAFDDDAIILASHVEMLERVIDTHRDTLPSISSSASFQEAEASLPDGRVLFAFIDTASLHDEIDDALAAEAVTSVGGLGDLSAVKGIGISVSAESDGIALDVVSAYDAANLTGALRDQVTAPDGENPLLGSIPADAWGVAAARHFQYGLEEAARELERADPAVASDLEAMGLTGPEGLLGLLGGDMAIALMPDDTTTVGGALLLTVDDEDAARAAAETLAEGLSDTMRSGGGGRLRWEERTHADGTRISVLRDGSVAYAVRDDVLVVGTSVEQVIDVLDVRSDGSITGDPAFVRGIEGVPTTDGVFYVDVARIVNSIHDALPPEERDDFDRDLGPDLRKIRSVAFGVDMDQARQRFRMFVAIPEQGEVT